jgi:hypothetical protein
MISWFLGLGSWFLVLGSWLLVWFLIFYLLVHRYWVDNRPRQTELHRVVPAMGIPA